MKKKRRRKRYGLLAFFFVLFFGGGIAFYVFAASNSTTTATNTVEVGKVEVELDMTNHDAGVIGPGSVSNPVSVANTGNYSAYIRMFVKKHWEITEGGVQLTQEQIFNKYPNLSVSAIAIQLKEGWTQGVTSSLYPGYECYYYNEAVPSGKSRAMSVVPFSDSYCLKTEETPGDGGITNELLTRFSRNGAKVDGYYEVIVEAIQADTCIPVVNGENQIVNWNDIPDTSAPMPTVSFDPAATPVGAVSFNSENTEITNADSFITMNNLVPGTTEERVVEIKNTSEQTLPVYVYAETAEEYDSLTDDQKEWLEQLQLVIGLKDGTILYQNSFYKPNSNEPMLSKDNPILIGNFPSNTSENLYVAIHCPASWTKGDVQVKVNWIFASKKAVYDSTPSPSVVESEAPIVIVTDAPVVTEMPSESPSDPPSEQPRETNVIVTEHPNWEEEETVPPATEQPQLTEQPQPENTDMVTEEPVPTPKPTEGIKPMASKDPDNLAPVETLEGDWPSDKVPKRTSTPKQPTKVEEVHPTKTGDLTPIIVWLVLFVVSCIGMISAFAGYRKRR